MEVAMLSGAGRMHEKCKKIKPLSKQQREKIYVSSNLSYRQRRSPGEPKFSPFTTVSRDTRQCYLLRVTQEPNTHTNYEVNYNPVTKRHRRSTIDKANFKRIIGSVQQQDYSVQINKKDKRCVNACKDFDRPKPLTARDAQKWRNTLQHLDFDKQIDPQRISPYEQIKSMKSTKDSFLVQTLKETVQSNFNNYRRFSLVPRSNRAHAFNSDSPHKYLENVLSREIEPEYETLNGSLEKVKKSMSKPKGELRFSLFRDQIKTRIDRNDPSWVQTLDYDAVDLSESRRKVSATLDFNNMGRREENQVHSKYPLRQSLLHQTPNNKAC